MFLVLPIHPIHFALSHCSHLKISFSFLPPKPTTLEYLLLFIESGCVETDGPELFALQARARLLTGRDPNRWLMILIAVADSRLSFGRIARISLRRRRLPRRPNTCKTHMFRLKVNFNFLKTFKKEYYF